MEVRSATLDEVRTAQARGEILKPVRLALCMTSCITSEELHTNFHATLERGFTPINDLLGAYAGASCSIVGAGPSINETHKELVGDVIAINSAIGFLLDAGIVPKFGLLWDGTEIVEKFARPHPDITYLVASRCHPKVFERLAGCKVIVWHAGGDHNIAEVMVRPEVIEKLKIPQPLVNGGSAGVTRTIYLASALGYTDIHIFGADSCYSDAGETHVRGSVVPEKDIMVSLGDNSEGAPALWFRTTPEWCAQVNEYRSIYPLTVSGNLSASTKHNYSLQIRLHVYGESLFKTMHDRLVAKRALQGDQKFISEIFSQSEEQWKLDGVVSNADANLTPKTTQPLEESRASQ
jgi:hypothetical protein